MDQLIIKGSGKVIANILMRSSTTGQPLTGLTAVTVQYCRDGEEGISLGTVEAASSVILYQSHGWKETAISGLYAYGIPRVCLSNGTRGVTLLFSASGAITTKYRIVVTGVDVHDPVRGGILALPDQVLDRGKSVTWNVRPR